MEDSPTSQASIHYLIVAIVQFLAGVGLLVVGSLAVSDGDILSPLLFADAFVGGAMLVVAGIVAVSVPIRLNKSGSGDTIGKVMCTMSIHQVICGLLLLVCAFGIVMIGISAFSECDSSSSTNCVQGTGRTYVIVMMVLLGVGLITAIIVFCLISYHGKRMHMPRHRDGRRIGTGDRSPHSNVNVIHINNEHNPNGYYPHQARHMEHNQGPRYQNYGSPETDPAYPPPPSRMIYNGDPSQAHPPPSYYSPSMSRGPPPIYSQSGGFKNMY